MSNYSSFQKIIIIGSSATGKTSLLYQFNEGKFYDVLPQTLGVEFTNKMFSIGDKNVKVQLWDTAGQERFRAVTRTYYRGASGVLLVYDVCSRESFNSLDDWLNDARNFTHSNAVILLLANKIDRESDREITTEQGSEYAKRNDLLYMEASAKTGNNVAKAFEKIAEEIQKRMDEGKLDMNLPTPSKAVFSTDNKKEGEDGGGKCC